MLNPVLRHPLISLVASAGVLIVLAIPAFSLHLAVPGPTSLPQNLSVVKTYNKIQKIFPGQAIPAVVAVRADDVTAPPVARAIAALRAEAAASPLFRQPSTLKVSAAHTVAEVDIPVVGNGNDSRSNRALAQLRVDGQGRCSLLGGRQFARLRQSDLDRGQRST